MTYIVSIAVVWVICGVLAYGLVLVSFQVSFPQFAYKYRRSHRGVAAWFALTGPIGLMAVLALTYSERLYHNGEKIIGFPPPLMFKTLTRTESLAAHNRLYPHLTPDF